MVILFTVPSKQLNMSSFTIYYYIVVYGYSEAYYFTLCLCSVINTRSILFIYSISDNQATHPMKAAQLLSMNGYMYVSLNIMWYDDLRIINEGN